MLLVILIIACVIVAPVVAAFADQYLAGTVTRESTDDPPDSGEDGPEELLAAA